MAQELIVIKQLPIIEEHLRELATGIDQQVSEAKSLVCTDATYKNVKKTRADLNGKFKALEEQRTAVKKAIMGPYTRFESVYRECVSEKFKDADETLKAKIGEVEDALKQQKRIDAEAYFDEYAQSKGIDFLTFDGSGIQVTLTGSAKSLRAQAKTFIEKVTEDLDMIETQEFKEEILVEYKKSLNVSTSITTVSNRHAAIEAEKQRQADIRAEQERRVAGAQSTQQVIMEIVVPPVAAPAPAEETALTPETESEKRFVTSFTVRGTLEQLKTLKEFLIDGGYDYESN